MALATLLAGGTARAQSVICNGAADFPCGNQIQNAEIQRSPTLLKFQARVSQAKLPIADGLFRKILVSLKSGSETLCTEEFHDVRISQSTVNLEIGRNIDCELDQVVAENQELAFQVCIGGATNCLNPVALGATPYSIKSTFAQLAQQAHVSDVAGQAHYAHRASADRDMLQRKELGAGYFDFSTPRSAPGLHPAPADFAPFAHGGFLTWTPMHESAPTLHIAARDAVRDTPIPLDRLLLVSNSTETLGRLVVKANGIQVTGASSIDGPTTVIGMLKVEARTDGAPSGMAVQGPGRFTGALDVGRAMTVSGGGLHVTGDSDFDGALSISGALSSNRPLTVMTGGASIAGDLTLGGSLVATGTLGAPAASFTGLAVGATGLTVNGPLAVTGLVSLTGAIPLGGVPGNFNVPNTLTAGALQVSGATTLASVAASGNIGSAGKSASSGFPSGWSGMHTNYVLAEGSLGVGPSGGPPAASIDSSGTVRATSAVLGGNLQVTTINGKTPGGGLRFYWATDCWTTTGIPDPIYVTIRTGSIYTCRCDAGDKAISWLPACPGYSGTPGLMGTTNGDPSGRTVSFACEGEGYGTLESAVLGRVGCLSGLW